MTKHIALIGCGTIGKEIAYAVDSGKIKNASIVSLLDKIKGDAEEVVEAASQDAVNKFCKTILENGKSLIIMSVGALADQDLWSELQERAVQNRSRIYVPTGAI